MTENPIFNNIDTGNFIAMRYNSLALAENENSELEVIGRDESGEIMAFQHRILPIYSFQFHPESIGTPDGLKLFQNWIKLITKN
jgi:anthranilate synthase component 2